MGVVAEQKTESEPSLGVALVFVTPVARLGIAPLRNPSAKMAR
jgi:hypothetical protein